MSTPSTAGALAGRAVVVTGAGRGLGAAYVDCLLNEGAAVIANDLDRDALEQIAGGHAGALELVPGDITDPATSAALVSTALTLFGRLDATVANAGLLRSGPLVKVSADDFDAVQAVHVRGTLLLLQAAATHWRHEAKAGRPVAATAVTTTSSAGLYGFLGEAAYSAAKAAIAAMTLVAAEELARYGVIVNAIAPVARTRMTGWMGEPPGDAEDPYSATNVAPVVAWLVGDGARTVSGRVLEVGGGQISIADGWRPGPTACLPSRAAPAEVGSLVERLLVVATEPQPVGRPDPALLETVGS